MVYEGKACGYDQGHRLPKKGYYRQAMVCEAVRLICKSDVDDDPNAATFMMPLADWNRYRHHTYKDRREAELPYIRSADVITVEQTPAVKPTPARPPIYTEFELVSTGIHIVTRRDGTSGQTPCEFWNCGNSSGFCKTRTPFKVVNRASGKLFAHLKACL